MADSSNEERKNLIDPEVPGAVGSRNSQNREGRNEYEESKLIIEDEINHILNHVETKLTPEALEKLQVGGNVKEVLHTYFNQTFHNMYNRYLVTVEDELSKKFRDMVDREEYKNLNDYTPTQVADLLDQLGDSEDFNSSEVEKSIVNTYGNLQTHLQTGLTDLQRQTEQILLGKSDIGSMVRSDHSYALVKCQFINNKMKPETVQDINLVINILEAELLSPLFHFQTATEGIIKEVISDHILTKLDQEIETLNTKVAAGAQGEMSEPEQVFEKFKRLEQYVDFQDTPDSPQYSYVAKEFFATLEGIGSDFVKDETYDPLNIRENLQRFVDEGNLRTSGFNAAVNALTNILDDRQLSYQHIENFKNGRKVVISEYADRSPLDLPDEKFAISLMYYDDDQLKGMRGAYSQQMSEFMTQVQKLWEVFDKVAKNERRNRRQSGEQVLNYQEVSAMFTGEGAAQFDQAPKQPGFLAKLMGADKPSTMAIPEVPENTEGDKQWDEVVFIQAEKSEREKLNDTFSQQRVYMNRKIKLLRTRIEEAFGSNYTDERLIITQRLDFLESSLDEYDKKFNPFNVRPGLFVELSMSTIVKKQTTLKAMSDVLSLFLDTIAKGFRDVSGANWRANSAATVVSEQTGFKSMPEETGVNA